jgi:hypothetical protein
MKKSILDELQKLKKEVHESDDYSSHFLVGIDLEQSGAPHASMMISKGKPFETLGMIDILIQNLKDTRKEIASDLTQKNNKDFTKKLSGKVEKAMQSLPKHVRNKVIEIKRRLDKAYEEQDAEALEKIKAELQQLKHDELGDDNDDDNFNISDFKGGLA